MKRQAITPDMKIASLLMRAFVCCNICGERIGSEDAIDWDHVQALIHGGAHHAMNIRPLHRDCHKIKTKFDVQANAKVKRLRNPKPSKRPMRSSGRKIPSRPFPKRANSTRQNHGNCT